MEFASESGAPNWVGKLAKILEDEGKVGLFAFRDNNAKRNDLKPSVFVGCSLRGNSSNYSTSMSDLMYSMSSVDKAVSTVPCNFGMYENFRKILPGHIVGKYYVNYDTLTAIVCGRVVLAVCDLDTREMFIPDVSSDIEWTGENDTNVGEIASFISEIVDIMEVSHYDELFMRIKSASNSSTHVKLLEVKAETSFDEEQFASSCMDSLKKYEETLENSYRKVFDDMKRDVQIAQGRGIVDALELMAFMKEKHFIFVNPSTLKYTCGKILANTAIYKDALYETKSELWISGLRVIVDNGVITDAKCYRAYHPNCSGRHVCLGELSGIPIKEVDKVIEALKVPNFSNGYWSGSSDYLNQKLVDLEGDTERIWSSDD